MRPVDAFFRSLSVTCFLTLGANIASASWISDITGINIDIPKGKVTIGPPKPQAIGPMLKNLPKDIAILLLNPNAPTLAFLIRQAKANALPEYEIPEDVKTTLGGRFFPSGVLQDVRWAPYDSTKLTLDTLVGWIQGEGAITLDDRIVFRGAKPIDLWAHELTHVMQYRNMGVEAFAALYMINWWNLEQQARDYEAIVNRSLQSTNEAIKLEPGAFSKPISWPSFTEIVRASISPETCIWIHNDIVGNKCPITIVITEILLEDQKGKQQKQICVGSACIYNQGMSGPIHGARGYHVKSVKAAYGA